MAQVQEKRQYNKTEKAMAAYANQVKVFDLSDVNKKYVESFKVTKYPLADEESEAGKKQKASWLQYKSSVGNFLQIVGKDAVEVTEADLAIFVNSINNVNTRTNKIAHIKSFLVHLIQNNVENCIERASRDTLILIIGM